MITEDYVNYDIAKLLRDKGFDEQTVRCHNLKKELCVCQCRGNETINSTPNYLIAAPTIQMVLKWLREVHNLIITIDYDSYELPFNKHRVGYGYSIQQTTNPTEYFKIGEFVYDNYEDACEAAIKYALENLI